MRFFFWGGGQGFSAIIRIQNMNDCMCYARAVLVCLLWPKTQAAVSSIDPCPSI